MTTIYAAMRGALVVATGGSGDWRATERLTDHDLECVAVAPEVPDRVFCGTFDAGLHRSMDGGRTFERVGTDVLYESVMSLAVSPHDPDVIWAGTEPSAVYRSTDGGDTWEERPGLTDLPSASEWYFPPRPHTHHVRWIEPDRDDRERLYVGIEAGALVITPDGGDTWTERPPGSRRDNHSLATHPDAPSRVYSAAGDGYAESTNDGESWEHPQEGLEHRYCWSVKPDPDDPDTVVMSSASGPRRAHTAGSAESYVYRRVDGGNWEHVTDGLPTGEGLLRPVLATTGEPGTFYAACNRGIFRSVDAGVSWDRLAVPWDERFERQTTRGLAVV